MSDLSTIEPLLRGGAASLSLSLGAMLLLSQVTRPHETGGPAPVRNGVLGALLGLGTAAYAVVSAPEPSVFLGAALGPLIFLAKLNSVFFWAFSVSVLVDAFRWRHPMTGLAGAIVLIDAVETLGFGAGGLGVVRLPLVAALAVHVLILAIGGYRGDLVDARRRLRVVLVGILGLSALVIVAGEAAVKADWAAEAALAPLQAAALWCLAAAFLLSIAHPRADLFGPDPMVARQREHSDREIAQETGADEHVSVPVAAEAPEVQPLAPRDLVMLRRLEQAVADGALFEEGMSIGRLSEIVGAPEHRLRKLINTRLGHRNFTAFLNATRIPRAQALLADPERAEMQITQVALDVGFASLGPFNRAFREAVGMTPSAWRMQAFQKVGLKPPPADS